MSVIRTDPQIVSGTPCFAGTRVPVDSLFDYLGEGRSLEDFLHDFPSVTRAQAQGALEEARQKLLGPHWLRDRQNQAPSAGKKRGQPESAVG